MAKKQMTEERVIALWSEYMPDVPPAIPIWEPWLYHDIVTFTEALEILGERRTQGRFEGLSTTSVGYSKYLSRVLENMAFCTVPVTMERGYRFTEEDFARFSTKWQVSDTEHAPDGTACQIWEAAGASGGYGAFCLHGDKRQAHQVSFFVHAGDYMPWPNDLQEMGLELDHWCRHSLCVNPRHLRLMESSLNRSLQSNPRPLPDGLPPLEATRTEA